MAAQTNQIRLPFDNLTPSGLKPVLKKFEKFQCKVASVDAPNKSKRESGFAVKRFTLKFEDGQQLEVAVKADGTVFQTKLNKKAVPIHAVDNMDRAITELIDYVQENAKAYQRAKIQREKRIAKLAGQQRPSITTSRKEKIEQAKAHLAEVQSSNDGLQKQLDEINAGMNGKQGELDAASKALQAEKALTTDLEKQIADLQAEGAK